MLVGVIGGNLQGVEATYLARKAGWEVLLVDRQPVVPAAGLCDRFVQLDVTAEKDLETALRTVDLIIPALENDNALICLEQWARDGGIPFAFDSDAYSVTSSKLGSNQLFTDLGLSIPALWPECRFPVIAKPITGSGSHGVSVFCDSGSLENYIRKSHQQWIIQEYIPGPSYSIEVMGLPGCHVPLQVTGLEMDAAYDCKRVSTPTKLARSLISDFENIAVTLADHLNLKGLMDVEVILHDGRLKVLEIDARLPSQTPTVVFRSTGFNMIEVLAELLLNPAGKFDASLKPQKGVVYEHIKVSSDLLEVAGENVMTLNEALFLHRDFFGADEAITNYCTGRDKWVATLIISDDTIETVREKRRHVIEEIRQYFNLDVYRDPEPVGDIKKGQL